MTLRRYLTDHIVVGDEQANQLTVEVLDAPGPGNACHEYQIGWYGSNPNMADGLNISFQNGPIKEAGLNGITNEALLAIVIDRLRSFQAGSYSCSENEAALYHCKMSLSELQRRTQRRLARNVEGTNQP